MKTLLCGTTAALNHLLDSTHVSSQWERCSCDILAPSCFPVIPLPYLGGTYCRAVQSSHTSGHCFHVKRQKRKRKRKQKRVSSARSAEVRNWLSRLERVRIIFLHLSVLAVCLSIFNNFNSTNTPPFPYTIRPSRLSVFSFRGSNGSEEALTVQVESLYEHSIREERAFHSSTFLGLSQCRVNVFPAQPPTPTSSPRRLGLTSLWPIRHHFIPPPSRRHQHPTGARGTRTHRQAVGRQIKEHTASAVAFRACPFCTVHCR